MPVAIRTLRKEPFFTERVNLDGTQYVLDFQWNQRDGWYLGLLDRNRTTIFSPRKLVLDFDILQPLRWRPNVPQGALIAYDLDGLGVKPGFLDLMTTRAANDGRVVLVYFSATERAALVAEALA